MNKNKTICPGCRTNLEKARINIPISMVDAQLIIYCPLCYFEIPIRINKNGKIYFVQEEQDV